MSKSLSRAINERYQIWAAYHMTHINNLAAILNTLELRSHNAMNGQNYYSLANDDVQAGRATITVVPTQKPLHDYVPLYLGFKTPMVAFNQEHNDDLLFLRFSLDILNTPGSIICDGNARSNNSKFYLFTNLDTFSHLDIAAIRTVKYAYSSEVKRKKQAEVLIPDQLPVAQIYDIVCHSENAKNRILSILKSSGINKSVIVKQGWYFGTPK